MMPAQEDDAELVQWRINSWRNRIAPEGYCISRRSEKLGTKKI